MEIDLYGIRSRWPTIRKRSPAPTVDPAGGTTSLRALALALNAKGIPAPRGGAWYASSVRNALALADDA